MFNTAEIVRPQLNSLSSENHAPVSIILNRAEDSCIIYPPLLIVHQILSQSPGHDNAACNLIFVSASDPNSRHVVKLNSSGKYECNLNCIRYKSYKICFHKVTAAVHKLELKNFVLYFEKHFKNKMNNLVDFNMFLKLGQKKTKSI